MIPYKTLDPSRRYPFGTILLVSVNIALFLYLFFLPEAASERFVYQNAVIPSHFRHFSFSQLSLDLLLTVFTAMFMHGGWMHLIGNMLYLWIFGENVEERMGSFRFLLFYLFCGIVATAAQIAVNGTSKVPILGASGAISGILAAYLRLFPKGKIAVLVPIFVFLRSIVFPAWLVLGFWFGLQLLQAYWTRGQAGGGIAYFAHLGGFAAGFLLLPFFLKKK
jgi:membrane associated rhomboid family serine protease